MGSGSHTCRGHDSGPGVQEESVLSAPGVKETVEEDAEEEENLEEEDVRTYRTCAARANYLAQDRPDISYASKECCRHMAGPSRKNMEALRRIARYLKGRPRLVYLYGRQRGDPEKVEAFSDTDFAGCRKTRRSTSGGCLVRGGHLIKHWSATQKTIALSSGEAELMGIIKTAGEALGLQSLCLDLGMQIEIKVHADSSAAIGICQRTGLGKVRHIAVGHLWIQERLKMKDFQLKKVLGTSNPADILTKPVARTVLEGHLPRMSLEHQTGRALSAPKLV